MKKSLLISGFVCLSLALFSCKPDTDTSDFPSNLAQWSGDQEYTSPTELPALSNQSAGLDQSWWKNSAFYHIWIKSFKDSDLGDCSKNCGDFKGIQASLDYIQNDLGCDAIWLSPFWDCSYKGSTNEASAGINMHGYDVVDFYKVNSYFGTGDATPESAEKELDDLIKACHDRGMKIIFDFIPNHTSDQNQWFKDSASRTDDKTDWYMWNSTSLNWKNTWNANAWHKNTTRNQYYYAAFADTQPDLNYRNYEVREEMKNVVRYWLNKGFDGLRIDAVRYLVESSSNGSATLTDTDETHEWFKELRKVIDEYESPKFMVCEAWIENDRSSLDKYFGTDTNPEFNMVLDFDQGWNCIDDVRDGWDYNITSRLFYPSSQDYAYGTFLGNHDEYHARLGDWFDEGTSKKAILTTALSLLRPTVPFIYYGNEVAQKSGDNSGDFRLRQPFKWSLVTSQKSKASSILNTNKTLLNLRSLDDYKDLFAYGSVTPLNADMIYTDDSDTTYPWYGALAYIISYESKRLMVVANLTSRAQSTLWFIKPDFTISDYSMIVGNEQTSNGIFYETYTNGVTDLIFHNFNPNEIRVYDLSSDSKECLLDLWDYNLSTMYLSGSFNNWTMKKMSFNGATNEFSASVALNAGTKYEFKFDELGDWAHAFGAKPDYDTISSLDSEFPTDDTPGLDNNFGFTPESTGTYTFIFNKETYTIKVTN